MLQSGAPAAVSGVVAGQEYFYAPVRMQIVRKLQLCPALSCLHGLSNRLQMFSVCRVPTSMTPTTAL